jgi:hypothetical protein
MRLPMERSFFADVAWQAPAAAPAHPSCGAGQCSAVNTRALTDARASVECRAIWLRIFRSGGAGCLSPALYRAVAALNGLEETLEWCSWLIWGVPGAAPRA